MSLAEAGEGSYMNHLKTRLIGKEGDDEDARKRLRIERLKQQREGAQKAKTQAVIGENDWAHTKTL